MNDEPKKIEPTNKRGGAWVTFGDEQYRIPSIGFHQLNDLEADARNLVNMGTVPTEEQLSTVEKVIHRAMLRNYPALTLEQVHDMLDLSNFLPALAAAVGSSQQ